MADNSLYSTVAKLEQQMSDIKDWQEEIKQSVKDVQVTIQNMTIQNDQRYAPKSTETTVNAWIWVVLVAVILAGLAVVMKNKNEL